jgi:hypothetical protein
MSSNPYEEAERQLNEVLAASVELAPGGDFEEARRYLDHGEYELALDTIAATIAQAGKRVGAELYAKFVALGREMGFDESNWDSIRPAR